MMSSPIFDSSCATLTKSAAKPFTDLLCDFSFFYFGCFRIDCCYYDQIKKATFKKEVALPVFQLKPPLVKEEVNIT